MIDIKRASERDAPTLARLASTTYRESHGHFINNENDLQQYLNHTFSTSKITEEINHPDVRYYILYVNNTPAGYGKLIQNVTHECFLSSNNCKLDRIYILYEFIHLKIGQLLIDRLHKEARKLHQSTMWLTVYIENYRAIRFYEKNAFDPVGNIDFPVNGTNYSNIIFAKTL